MSSEVEELLGERWHEVEARAHELVHQGREKVTHWRWAPDDAQLEHPSPLWSERHGSAPRDRLWDRRPERADVVAYGFDVAERLIFSMREDASGETADATTWIGGADGSCLQLYFARSAGRLSLRRVARRVLEADRLVGMTLFFDPREGRGKTVEAYEYDDAHDAISRIVKVWKEPQEEDDAYVYDVLRDDDGEVTAIRLRDGADMRMVYRRRDSRAIRDSRRRVERDLPELAIRWSRRVLLDREVRAIALVYGVDDPGLPPALAAAVGHDAPGGEEAYWPAEFEIFDPEPAEFRDPAFREDCRVLNQEWAATENEREPRATLVKLAKTLSRANWSEILGYDCAPVVYAVDEELADLRSNLRAAGIASQYGD